MNETLITISEPSEVIVIEDAPGEVVQISGDAVEIIEIADAASEIIEVSSEIVEIVEIVEQGAPGAQGVPGHTPTIEEIAAIIGDVILTAVDANYVHNQFIAASVWTIDHNLNKYPAVSAMDSANSEVYGRIEYPSPNQVIITFSSAFGGRAVCN